MKLSKTARIVIMCSVAVVALGVTSVVFFLTRPLRVAVPAERVSAYIEVLGAWNGLPALNVQIDTLDPSGQLSGLPVHETIIDPASQKLDQPVSLSPSAAVWTAALAGRVPARVAHIVAGGKIVPISFNPLMVFKRPTTKRAPVKKPEWLLAGKDDLILGSLIGWASANSEPFRVADGLAHLSVLASSVGRIQPLSFAYPASDVVELFRTGSGAALVLTLSGYRALPQPMQVGLVPSNLPEIQVGGKKLLFSASTLRVLVFDEMVESGLSLAVLTRVSLPEVQRRLADVSSEVAAVLDAPVRDAVDYTAIQMLRTSTRIVGPALDTRFLVAGRSVLASPKELEAVQKEFE